MKETIKIQDSQIPTIGLGTWKSKPGEVYRAILTALTYGYRHLDCASIYGNEIEIGKALKEAFDTHIVRREDLWITSKLWNDSHKPNDVESALQKTLEDLQLEYLDLYLIHWPVAFHPGVKGASGSQDFIPISDIPLEFTWSAILDVRNAGLARYVGVSNFTIGKIEHLYQKTYEYPAMNQVEMHPYLPQEDLLLYAQKRNITVTAYAPLGSGDRPNNVESHAPVLLHNKVINNIAEHIGCTAAQVLLSWQTERGVVSIPKSTHPSRIKENYDSQSVTLTEEQVSKINGLQTKLRYIDGSFFTQKGSPYTMDYLWES